MSIQEVEMSAAVQHPIGPHTVEDWLALPEPTDGSRTELISGYFHMSPSPAGRHQRVVHRLTRQIEDAIWAAGRKNLHVVPGVAVRISSALRTGLIPDVVVLDQDPELDASFPAESMLMAVEVWSPGNTRAEQESKVSAFASAGVPFVWTVNQRDRLELTAYRLVQGRYLAQDVLLTDCRATVEAAPLPIPVDLSGVLGW
ncbi:Uma2 family endonuclease [Saccharothrix lopnurensis]|uniref:Uma2 family endonuclease n=1 Tax=Saccharothrix lopnurensis TaxID=1670621 RepID=A0ABW1P0U2_9PSEU